MSEDNDCKPPSASGVPDLDLDQVSHGWGRLQEFRAWFESTVARDMAPYFREQLGTEDDGPCPFPELPI